MGRIGSGVEQVKINFFNQVEGIFKLGFCFFWEINNYIGIDGCIGYIVMDFFNDL